MRIAAPVLLAAVMSGASSHAQSTPAAVVRGDAGLLQGTWRVIDARARMLSEPAMIIDGMVDRTTIIFEGTTVTMRQLGNADFEVYQFTLDTLARPRRIRMVDPLVADSARWTGIYRISGDTLRLSLPVEHHADRPVPPSSFNGTNTVAYVFTREPKPPAPPPPDGAAESSCRVATDWDTETTDETETTVFFGCFPKDRGLRHPPWFPCSSP